MAFELTAAPILCVTSIDAFIWMPSIEPLVSLATKNGLTPVRGPERYESSPVATTEVVYPDNSGYWVCFSEAHL